MWEKIDFESIIEKISEKQGEDKLVMTRADKDESGQFVKGDPVTYTRKKE